MDLHPFWASHGPCLAQWWEGYQNNTLRGNIRAASSDLAHRLIAILSLSLLPPSGLAMEAIKSINLITSVRSSGSALMSKQNHHGCIVENF